MQTPHRWFGAGHSTAADSAEAGTEAAASAIGGRTPELVLVFCSPRHDLPALLLGVRAEAGPEATVVGATTLGELAYDGVSDGGVAVAALGGAGFSVRTRISHIRDVGHRQAGAAAAEAMAGVSHPHSVLILLADGMAGEPHEVVRGAYAVVGATVPMVGGFAGATVQFVDETLVEDAVIGVALGSDGPIGIGVAHGWRRMEPPMVVTRSSGGTVYELDDEPALDVLLRRTGLATAAELFDRERNTIRGIGLSRRNGEDMRELVEGDDAARWVRSPADVPQGTLCWLMDDDPGGLVGGAAESCEEAVEGLGGKTPLGALAFDCADRRRRLGAEGARAEMAAMRAALGSAPYAGFYTSAEIARVRGALGTHHLSLVTLAVA